MFPGLTSHLLTLRCWFFFPFMREVFLFGGLSASSRENIDHLLRRYKDGSPRPGKAVVLVVGGAVEALSARPGSLSLVLTKRFGFVRKAIEHGVPLVPCFAFGENELYMQSVAPEGSFTRRFQDAFKRVFTVSTPMVRGRGVFNYSFGLLPKRHPVTVIVGAPIETEGGPNESPATEEIQRMHARYVEALTELFEKNKLEHGLGETDHLEIT